MKLRLALAVATALGGLAVASMASAAPVTANASATTVIVSPGSVAKIRDLDFGTIAKPTAGTTTVTVASAATGTATPTTVGGNGFVPTPGLAFAATFRLVGTPSTSYTVATNDLSFPTAGANLTSIGSESPLASAGTVGSLPASGTHDLYIGGHFDISPSTTPATYNGTLTLTINFP